MADHAQEAVPLRPGLQASQHQGDPVLLPSQVQSCRVRKMETASFLLPSVPEWSADFHPAACLPRIADQCLSRMEMPSGRILAKGLAPIGW